MSGSDGTGSSTRVSVVSYLILRPNRMLIVCVAMDQVYTHTEQNMDTKMLTSQYIIFSTKQCLTKD
jgi:hypothetical protein